MTVWTPHKPIFGTKRIPQKIGTWKFRDWARITPFGPLGTLKGPDIKVKVCGDHKFNPIRPFEGSWDQIWPTGALLGPPKSPKGPFGAKTSPFRATLGPEGA